MLSYPAAWLRHRSKTSSLLRDQTTTRSVGSRNSRSAHIPEIAPSIAHIHEHQDEANRSNVNVPIGEERASVQRPIAELLDDIGSTAVNAACHGFVHLFPEFGFLHPPSLQQDLHNGTIPSLKIAAILALCARPKKDTCSEASVGEQCAEYVRRTVMNKILDGPSQDIVETLVMISLYEWGNGRGYQSWTYLGMCCLESS